MTRSGSRIQHIAIWTGDLSVANGQNIVTRRVAGSLASARFTIFNYPIGGGTAICIAILSAFKLILASLNHNFDTIYVVCSRSTLGFLRDVPVLLLSRLGKRIVVHVHGSDFPLLLERRGVGRFARWLYSRCEIIVPSMHLLPLLEGYRFGSIVVCENFADLFDTQSGQRNDGIEGTHDLVILWNSNVMASKGIVELFAGMRKLRMRGARLKLIVLGQPIGDAERTKDQMQSFLNSLTKENWIDVVGPVAPEEVRTYIAACDVVALPSTYASECQPLAIIEAMLAGRELIVADTLALRATVGNYPAMLVKRTPAAIAAALRSCLRDQEQPQIVSAADLTQAAARFAPDAFDRRMAVILNDRHGRTVD